MADKDFRVKNRLHVNGLSQSSGVILATNNNLDSHTTVPTQYGGTGTTTSPNAGQIPYSSSGTNYAPTDLSSLTISSSGGSTITADSASTKGLIIKGASSQTANLQEWQNSSATVLTKVDKDGIITAPAVNVVGQSISTNTTMVAGYRYFVDTSAARTLTLPAVPSVGDEIQIFDASGSAATYNITILRNGNLINGVSDDAIIDVNQASSTFVYTGATVGWRFD